MKEEKVSRRGLSRLLALPLLGGAVAALTPKPAAAQEAANKTSAMIATGDIVFAANGQTVEILREVVKTSKPTDLILAVTAESSIITQVTTIGDDLQRAEGRLEVFVTIDGKVVGPMGLPSSFNGNPPHGDTGPVVFANQIYERQTQLGNDDQSDTIRTYLETRHAAGFNWMAFNVGSGVHDIRVYAQYTESPVGANRNPATTFAEGVIGKRSLIVEPVKAFVRETITLN